MTTFSLQSLVGELGWKEALSVGLGYLALQHVLRWKRYNDIHRKFGDKIDRLTVQDAQEIAALSTQYDMPTAVGTGVAVGFLKTHAIPSISELLVNTGQLSQLDAIAKRHVDTGIMIETWTSCPLSKISPSEKPQDLSSLDPRAYLAIARVNWLHRKYKISNDDFLYTLSMFVIGPIRGAEAWGWRTLSPLECQAIFVLWCEVGRLMNIKDIPDTLEELITWAEAYEERYMVPAITNHQLIVPLMEVVTSPMTTLFGWRKLWYRIFICLQPDRLRVALMLPEQPRLLTSFANGTIRCIAFYLRYLALPLVWPRRTIPEVFKPNSSDGSLPRMRPKAFNPKPWYKPEPQGLARLVENVKVAIGLQNAEDVPGPKFRSQGYRLEELGPIRYEDYGHDEVIREAGEMLGCPLSGHWARKNSGS
ncbi:hypothetical protein DENSPDRAFT_836710 [Dentipellis sp. KUC8613]|nr:hypothetical protein DENSPDRAFT_836710 [Dentipellis sp. KUC8613]